LFTAAGFGILLFFLAAHILHHAGVLADSTWDIRDRPALSLGILLMVIGVQFFCFGLLAELMIKSTASGDKPYSVSQVLEEERDRQVR
jgi:hypothetical protein